MATGDPSVYPVSLSFSHPNLPFSHPLLLYNLHLHTYTHSTSFFTQFLAPSLSVSRRTRIPRYLFCIFLLSPRIPRIHLPLSIFLYFRTPLSRHHFFTCLLSTLILARTLSNSLFSSFPRVHVYIRFSFSSFSSLVLLPVLLYTLHPPAHSLSPRVFFFPCCFFLFV